jgi:hypothetical protein
MSLGIVFVLAFAAKASAPVWILLSVGILLFVMGFLTVGLFARECYVSIRNRVAKPR